MASRTPAWVRLLRAEVYRQFIDGKDLAVLMRGRWRISIERVRGIAPGHAWEVRSLDHSAALYFHGITRALDEACTRACDALALVLPPESLEAPMPVLAGPPSNSDAEHASTTVLRG